MLLQPSGNFSDPLYILWYIVSLIIFLLLLTIVLKIALGFVSGAKHKDFGEVFVTSLIIVVVVAIVYLIIPGIGFLALLVGLILMWLIISSRHDTGFVTAIGVSVVAFIIAIILLFILGLILGALGLGITIITFI